MASRRKFKEQVKNICGSIAAECIMSMEFIPDIDVDKMDEVIEKLAALQENTIAHMSFSFEKSQRDYADVHAYRRERKAYVKKAYKALTADFEKGIQGIVKEMNALLPQAQKDANKAK